MFTKWTLGAISWGFQLTSALAVLPFSWDREAQKLKLAANVFRRGMAWLLQILSLLNCCNMAWAFFDGIVLASEWDYIRISFDILYLSCFTLVSANGLVYNFKCEDVAFLFTELMAFNRRMTRERYGATKHPLKRDGCEFVPLFTTATVFFPTMFVMMFLINNDARRFLYYYVPVETRSFWTLALAALFEAEMLLVIVCHIFPTVKIMVLTNRCLSFWLQRLAEDTRENRKDTNDSDGKIDSILRSYNEMAQVNLVYNKIMASLIWPMSCLGMVCIGAFAAYGSVKLQDKLPLIFTPFFPVLTVLCLVSMFVLFPFAGQVAKDSNELIGKFLLMKPSEYNRKRVRALRPFGSQISSIFVITNTTSLNAFMLMSNLTINALLMN